MYAIRSYYAGALASFDDAAFEAAGAKVVKAAELWQSEIIYKVNAPTDSYNFV